MAGRGSGCQGTARVSGVAGCGLRAVAHKIRPVFQQVLVVLGLGAAAVLVPSDPQIAGGEQG